MSHLDEIKSNGSYTLDGIVHKFNKEAKIISNVRLNNVLIDYRKLTAIKKGYIILNEIADKINIKFIALGGTLLGVIRFGGILPWER